MRERLIVALWQGLSTNLKHVKYEHNTLAPPSAGVLNCVCHPMTVSGFCLWSLQSMHATAENYASQDIKRASFFTAQPT